MSPFAPGALVAIALVLASTGVQLGLPDPRLTPGSSTPAVTQENIRYTICRPGWTQSLRAQASVQQALKVELIGQYSYADKVPSHYALDSLIPMSLGGLSSDRKNSWPLPLEGEWSAKKKNELENVLHTLVCNGQLPLHDAQTAISSNWIEAYKKYVPQQTRRHP